MISRAEGIALIAISLDEFILSYLVCAFQGLMRTFAVTFLLPLLLLLITVTKLDILGSVARRITFTP